VSKSLVENVVVGDNVGEADGAGDFVGDIVGPALGSLVGEPEGERVGKLDGIEVGLLEGANEGDREGTCDGIFDDETSIEMFSNVGADVGKPLLLPSSVSPNSVESPALPSSTPVMMSDTTTVKATAIKIQNRLAAINLCLNGHPAISSFSSTGIPLSTSVTLLIFNVLPPSLAADAVSEETGKTLWKKDLLELLLPALLLLATLCSLKVSTSTGFDFCRRIVCCDEASTLSTSTGPEEVRFRE
jgi:hypothetical protein